MNKTKIEWCDFTVNPIRFKPHGSERTTTMCQKVSPGCTNCYAASIVNRFWPLEANEKFPGYTAQGIASGKVVLDEKQLNSVLKMKKPCKLFWGDMTDIFGEWVPFEMIDRCIAVCALTPHITHQFLTKRPERMLEYMTADTEERVRELVAFESDKWDAQKQAIALGGRWESPQIGDFGRVELAGYYDGCKFDWPLPNVWVGTSCENQKYADERIPILCQVPAKVHFISAEPLIGEIDLGYPKTLWPNGPEMCCSGHECGCQGLPSEPPLCYGLQLVITGGESGPHARPCHVEWINSIVNECKRWNIPVFVKQLGSNVIQDGNRHIKRDSKGGDMSEWPHEIRIREFPKG